MRTEVTLQGLQAALSPTRVTCKSIGFVPTMGNLHQGHINLVKVAKKYCDIVVVSIFVNPSQFGAGEDFEKYPRTLEADSKLLADAGCDVIFAPSVQQIYGNKPQVTTVQVNELTEDLCGKSRPGHFAGVATVVTKLFNMVQPNVAFFGEKDWQQLAVIRHLTADLCFNIEIVGVPTVRDSSGLALSSRNGYLSDSEKQVASQIHQVLKSIEQQLKADQSQLDDALQQGRDVLAEQGFVVDYLEARTPELKPVTNLSHDVIVLVAAKLGTTRLIDNLLIKQSH